MPYVGLPPQQKKLNMIPGEPAKPHRWVRLSAVELAECKQHHKVSGPWTGWPGRPCTESLTDLKDHGDWTEKKRNQCANAVYRFSRTGKTCHTKILERLSPLKCKKGSAFVGSLIANTALSIKICAFITPKAYHAVTRHKFWKAVELRMHHHVAKHGNPVCKTASASQESRLG